MIASRSTAGVLALCVVLTALCGVASAAPRFVGTWVLEQDITTGLVIEESDEPTCVVYDVNMATRSAVDGLSVYNLDKGVLIWADLALHRRISYVFKQDTIIFERNELFPKVNTDGYGAVTWTQVERACHVLHRAGPDAQAQAQAELARRQAEQQGVPR